MNDNRLAVCQLEIESEFLICIFITVAITIWGHCIDLFRNMQYIEQTGSEHFHTFSQYPELLNKKVTLLKYFRDYMNDHLVKVSIY